MELIAELEKEKRGVYAGAVGYFGYGSVEGDREIEGAMDVSSCWITLQCPMMLMSADVHRAADHARQGWDRLSASRGMSAPRSCFFACSLTSHRAGLCLIRIPTTNGSRRSIN